MALNILPRDVADEVKECAERASAHTAKTRKGKPGDADAEKVHFQEHVDLFKQKSKGLLSTNTCDEIKSMLWFAAWHTANTRAGYTDDASRDKRDMEEHYRNVVKSGEVTETLASNLKWMGWNAAWYAANTIVGYNDDAKRDKAKFEAHFNKICGEVNLVAMNFFTDEAKILAEKPKIVAEEKLINNGDTPQTMAFKFSVTEGKTSSTSHQIGFNYGVKTSFSAGFFGFADSKYELSFNFSHNHTFSESTNSGTTKAYEFPLTVPKHSTYVAKGTVHEATMDVPYELVFDFGGTRRSIKGKWNGVAVSKATYQIDKA